MGKLKPCPFCGERNISMSMGCWSVAQENDRLLWVDYWYVVCGKCGITSFKYKTETLAAEAWNRRRAMNDTEILPSAEPEQKTGKWIPKSPFTGNCSECGADGNLKDNFCPNCGARMEKQEDE